MNRIGTLIIIGLLGITAHAQDHQQQSPQNHPAGNGGDRISRGDTDRRGESGFPGTSGIPGGPGGFPGGPGGGPGGFPGTMFGMMGNIDQFGVTFDRTPLSEKDPVVSDAADSTFTYYEENIRFSQTVKVRYDGDRADVSGLPDGMKATVDGAHVSVSSKGMNVAYELTGRSADGSFRVKSDSPVKIVLGGVDLTSGKGEAIAVSGKADTYLVVSPGSANRLEDQYREPPTKPFGPFGMMPGPRKQPDTAETETVSGIEMKKAVNRSSRLTESQVDGVLTSKGMLCVSGNGELTLKGHNRNGLKSKSHLIIRPGNVINIEVTQGKGVTSKGDIRILGGVLNVDGSKSGKDGIHSEECVYILGGRTTVKASGGEGSEGIEAKYNMVVDGGVVEVAAFDDALNSGGNLIVNGGQIFAASVFNDALDANSNLVVNGGTVVAFGGSAPECALDANEEEGFSLYINGGTIAGIGGMGSRSAKGSRQPSVVCGVEQADSGTVYGLEGADGSLIQLTNIRNYSREASFLFSSPQLQAGQSYKVIKTQQAPEAKGFHGLSSTIKKPAAPGSAEVIESVEQLALPYSQVGKQNMMMGPPPMRQ